jgi:hypothetical protein
MGQIVIDIPNKKNRRYVLTESKRADELLTALDRSAIRVKNDPASPEETEYIQDVRDIEKAIAEFKRTGKTHRWEDVKAELGL